MVPPAGATAGLKSNDSVTNDLGTPELSPIQRWVLPSTPAGLHGLLNDACCVKAQPVGCPLLKSSKKLTFPSVEPKCESVTHSPHVISV